MLQGARGGSRGGRGGAGGRPDERKKRENILNLALYVDKSICVKLAGGREGEYIGKAAVAMACTCGAVAYISDWHSQRIRPTDEPRDG